MNAPHAGRVVRGAVLTRRGAIGTDGRIAWRTGSATSPPTTTATPSCSPASSTPTSTSRDTGCWPSPGRIGLLGPRSLFAHGIHLSERECARLAEAGATVVHCPTSNSFLGSGLFDAAHVGRPDRPFRTWLLVGLGCIGLKLIVTG